MNFGGRGRGRGKSAGPRLMKFNHMIQCILYRNVALFKGDTYTYRGIFRRHGGEFNKKYYGYVVSLDNVEAIKNELVPMIYGYVIQNRNEDLPVEMPTNFVEDTEEVEKKVQFSEEQNQTFENSTDTNFTI